MPEVRKSVGSEGGKVDLGVKVDWDGYAYKDGKREEARKARMNAAPITGGGENGTATAATPQTLKPNTGRDKKRKDKAWTRNAALADEKDERRERKKRKKAAESEGKMDGVQIAKKRELDELIGRVRERNLAEGRGGGEEG